MKWKDLSLKERKQIYDSVRVNNPDATYFDIKEQFDSIPTYEDGKGKTINKADLPPEYRTGTPEYFERQRKISGAINAVQPEAYITPAGYIKDAVNFIEDLGKGDYAGAAIDAALNLIPWGVGKTIKKIKKKVGRAIEGTDAYTAESYAESFTPTITKKKGKKVKTEADYDQEFAEVKRKYNNMQEYDKELSKITNDLFMPTDGIAMLLQSKYLTDRSTTQADQKVETANVGKVLGMDVAIEPALSQSSAEKITVAELAAGAFVVVAGTSNTVTEASKVLPPEKFRSHTRFGDEFHGLEVYGRKVVEKDAAIVAFVKHP